MKSSSAKAKGKLLEDYVADQIIAKGIDPKARRDGASGAGNREKGDICTSMMISGQNVGIECKNQATLKIQEWWRQTEKLCSLSREPVLAFKIFGEPLENTKVVIYLDTLLNLVAGQNQANKTILEPDENSQSNREQRYAIQQTIYQLKKLLKFYD
jgi:hypothetical protein